MTKHNNAKSIIGSIAAGVAGAAVGTAAVVLSNKNNRQKAGKIIDDAKNTGEELKERVEKLWSKTKGDVKKTTKVIQKAGSKDK